MSVNLILKTTSIFPAIPIIPLPVGITHWYKFENFVGNTLLNYANNTYDCSVQSVATIDKQIVRVGTGSILRPTATILPSFSLSSNSISVTFWIYPITTNNFSCAFSFATSVNQWATGMELQFLNNQLAFISTGSMDFQYISPIIVLNQWLHVACVIKNDNTATFYYNGILQNTFTASYPSVPLYNYNHIGSQLNDPNTDTSNPNARANYYMDDFRIYNGYALNVTEINEICNIPLLFIPTFFYEFDKSLTLNTTTGTNDATNTNVILDTSTYKNGTGSAKISGLSTPSFINTPNFTITANTGFTFACWFKVPAGTLQPYQPIFCNNNGNSPTIILGKDPDNLNCMFFL